MSIIPIVPAARNITVTAADNIIPVIVVTATMPYTFGNLKTNGRKCAY